jgi:hypothetical protein
MSTSTMTVLPEPAIPIRAHGRVVHATIDAPTR